MRSYRQRATRCKYSKAQRRSEPIVGDAKTANAKQRKRSCQSRGQKAKGETPTESRWKETKEPLAQMMEQLRIIIIYYKIKADL